MWKANQTQILKIQKAPSWLINFWFNLNQIQVAKSFIHAELRTADLHQSLKIILDNQMLKTLLEIENYNTRLGELFEKLKITH